VQVLTGALSSPCVLAAVVADEASDYKPHTSCLLFAREFYLEHRPTFRLTEAERATDTYERYRRQFPHRWDSGVGYGFRVFAAGLTWHPLRRSNSGPDPFGIANVYGDLIFHLGGAIRFSEPVQQREVRARRARLVDMVRQHGWGTVLQRAAVKVIPRPVVQRIHPEYYETPQQALARATHHLFTNPEGFLDRLRHRGPGFCRMFPDPVASRPPLSQA